MRNKTTGSGGRSGSAGAALAAVAASACCLGPVVLAALGIGGAWAGRLRALEPYRPALIVAALALLAFAFYRAYRTAGASCDAGGPCERPRAGGAGRAVVWFAAVLIVGTLVLPCAAPHLAAKVRAWAGAGGGEGCCVVPQGADHGTAAEPAGAGDKVPFDGGRDVLFSVETLECPLVPGVGCGHLLAPTIGSIDHLEGVERSFTNWTGDRIRVTVASAADRDAVADRVRTLLTRDGRKPARVGQSELEPMVNSQAWYGAGRVAELTTYEFRTAARKRMSAFASEEGLDPATTQKLLAIVDREWAESAAQAGAPPNDAAGYGDYWRSRVTALKAAVVRDAAGVLTPDQVEHLRAAAARGRAD